MRIVGARRIAIIAIGTLWVFAPGLAAACAVCFTGRTEETRQAFIGTTAFMTFLPVLVIGGVVWWIRRRSIAIRDAQLAQTIGTQSD